MTDQPTNHLTNQLSDMSVNTSNKKLATNDFAMLYLPSTEETKMRKPVNPIRWFGFMPPAPLKQSQVPDPSEK